MDFRERFSADKWQILNRSFAVYNGSVQDQFEQNKYSGVRTPWHYILRGCEKHLNFRRGVLYTRSRGFQNVCINSPLKFFILRIYIIRRNLFKAEHLLKIKIFNTRNTRKGRKIDFKSRNVLLNILI